MLVKKEKQDSWVSLAFSDAPIWTALPLNIILRAFRVHAAITSVADRAAASG